MKKIDIKLIFVLTLAIILLFILQNISKATASFSATGPSSPTVKVGDTISITVKANQAAGMYKVSTSNNNVELVSGNEEEFLEDSSATITYKAVKAGTVTITANAETMADLEDSSNQVTGSKTFTFIIKPEPTPTPTPTPVPTKTPTPTPEPTNAEKENTEPPYTPSFTEVNETVYATNEVNVRQSYSTSSERLGSLQEGESVTRTGKSTDGQWSRVKYKSHTAYIATSYLTTTKPEEEKSSNKNLATLTVKNVELTPNFDKDTTMYSATVSSEITKLEIEAKAEDSKATVEIQDNKELKLGDNIIRIKVTAEDNTVRTYLLNITKGEKKEETETKNQTELQLASLTIAGVNFEQGFNPSIYYYELSLNSNTVTSLQINAEPNQEGATVEIFGNENFKVGENIVNILLTSADGTKTANYQIKVIVPENQAKNENQNSTMSIEFYIILGVIIAVAIIGAGFFMSHRHQPKNENSKGSVIEENKADDILSLSEEQQPEKRPRGKHSK